ILDKSSSTLYGATLASTFVGIYGTSTVFFSYFSRVIFCATGVSTVGFSIGSTSTVFVGAFVQDVIKIKSEIINNIILFNLIHPFYYQLIILKHYSSLSFITIFIKNYSQ